MTIAKCKLQIEHTGCAAVVTVARSLNLQFAISICQFAIAFAFVAIVPQTSFAQAVPNPHDAPQVRETTHEILASPEFRHLARQKRQANPLQRSTGSSDGEAGSGDASRRSAGGRDGRDARDRRKSRRNEAEESSRESTNSPFRSFSGGAIGAFFGQVMTLVAWVALAAICGLILYLVARAVLGWEGSADLKDSAAGKGIDEDELDQAPGEIPADVYLARARELAAAGRYREAVAQLLLGAMSQIERAGLIRFRRGLTYRDYLRAVRPRNDAYDSFRAMVRVYEPIGFGRRDASRAHFETTLNGYETGFGATLAKTEN